MAANLPLSLSPHVTTVLSPDLIELLTAASLPPLHHIFQSYSPLPLVTTRTTAITPVQHNAFHLRFSSVDQIVLACKEDEESRSSRFVDWLGTRITRRAPRWVEDAAQRPLDATMIRTPWWEDLRRCVEGDWTPSRTDGWNHPVAAIYAVSTSAPNPLQAITMLLARQLEFPIWVDSTILRYILIVHTSKSPLNTEECTALYNAVRKQHGLHVHLIKLAFEDSPKPIPIIPLPPQLPPPNTIHPLHAVPDTSELKLSQADAQATGKFIREFLTQSLIPWMEKHVLEWNESFANNKRLGSRIFSSTRRMVFGGTAQTAPLTPSGSSGTFSPISPPSNASSTFSVAQPPPQHRRLAEFATFLGDYKVAVNVWESLRKEGKGGAAILPMLLSPSPTLLNYASQALAPASVREPSATALFNALVCAVRWEVGMKDFLAIGGERWLVLAASMSDEAATALLLAQAAHLSRLKGSKRRSALWYVMAAHRLEKCGVKVLTAYLLHEARSLFTTIIAKPFSPSFAESEGWPKDRHHLSVEEVAFPVILTNVEHSLGRIQYSSGDTDTAVRLFLGILRYSLQLDGADTDSVVVDDFKQALEHLETTHSPDQMPKDLTIPMRFCHPSESTIRLSNQDQRLDVKDPIWNILETRWSGSRDKGKGALQQANPEVGQPFWVDLILENPLETTLILRDFALRFSRSSSTIDPEGDADLAVSELIEEVFLPPKDRRILSIGVTPLIAGQLYISEAHYSFISRFPVKEELLIRGKRLNETASQRQGIEYAPPKRLSVTVQQGACSLGADILDEQGEEYYEFDDEDEIVLLQGEIRHLEMSVTNKGTVDVDSIWLLVDESLSIWIDEDGSLTNANFLSQLSSNANETNLCSNEIGHPSPVSIQIPRAGALSPGHSLTISIFIRAEASESVFFRGLLTYCLRDGPVFLTRFSKPVEVIPMLSLSSFISPNPQSSTAYNLRLEVENMMEDMDVEIQHLSGVATDWCLASKPRSSLILQPQQVSKIALQVVHQESDTSEDTTKKFIERISDFLLGRKVIHSGFPKGSLKLSYSSENPYSLLPHHLQHLVLSSRRRHSLQVLLNEFPTVPSDVLCRLFPLYSPFTFDVIIFWTLPSSSRYGFVDAFNIPIGVGHGMLNTAIDRAVESKSKSIYAETKREHELLLQHFRSCEWNRETNPIVVSAKAREGALTIEHDFAKGACLVPVEFTLLNYSPSNPCRYVLSLSPPSAAVRVGTSFPATYSGRLIHQGYLAPLENVKISASLRAPSSGQYALAGWRLEVEVGTSHVDQGSLEGADSTTTWTAVARYMQEPTGDEGSILVRGASRGTS